MTRARVLLLVVGLAVAVAVLMVAALMSRGDGPPDDEQASDGLRRTVFVGDSITRGVSPETLGPSDQYSWVSYALTDPRTPWRLEANRSVFGRTLAEMETLFDAEVLADDPEGVVIMGGTNDTLRALPVEDSVAALRSMLVAAQGAGAEVWVVSPPPIDPGYERDVVPLVDAEQELAAELDVPFVDLHAPLAQPSGAWLEGLSLDGVHPSEEGARRIADLVLDEFGRSGG